MGSGLTDYVLNERGDLFAIMVFNPDALKMDISAWMTIRENSCFIKDDPSVRIRVNCGTQYKGFLYALLHESAHLVDYVDHRTPYVEEDMKYSAKTAIPSSTALPEVCGKTFQRRPRSLSSSSAKISFFTDYRAGRA